MSKATSGSTGKEQSRLTAVAMPHLPRPQEPCRLYQGQAMTTKAEKQHMSKVAELGCAVCRRFGFEGTPAELHHPRAGTGAGRRSSHFDVIPLCPAHHRGSLSGIHGIGTKAWPKLMGFTEQDLLDDTRRLLGITVCE